MTDFQFCVIALLVSLMFVLVVLTIWATTEHQTCFGTVHHNQVVLDCTWSKQSKHVP